MPFSFHVVCSLGKCVDMSVLRSKHNITSISFHNMALLTLADIEQSVHTKVVNHNPISQTRVSQYSYVNVIVKGVVL